VESAATIRVVHPGKLEGANALRAITGKVGKAEAPIVVALADSSLPADTVARARVVAAG